MSSLSKQKTEVISQKKYHHLNGFSTGFDQYAYNILSGIYLDHNIDIFDFRYTTRETTTDSNGNSQTRNVHHTFSTAVLTHTMNFPQLVIRREGLFDKLAGFVGFDDIDFESDEFSRKFFVKSKDRRFAYDIVHPRMMKFLLDCDNYQVELDGKQIQFKKQKRFKTQDFQQSLDNVVQFFQHIPKHIIKQQE